MMDHAAGNQAAAFALAGDLHVLLSDMGAETAGLWAVIGGALLENESLIVPASHSTIRKPRHEKMTRAETLLEYTDSRRNWRRGLSGVYYAPIGIAGAKLMKLKPGQSAPMHGHEALEATVVLAGRFTDGHGTYTCGDLVLGEPGMRHKPAAVGDEECICFVAQRASRFWRKLL